MLKWAMTHKEFFERLLEIVSSADVPIVYLHENSYVQKENDKAQMQSALKFLIEHSHLIMAESSLKSKWRNVLRLMKKHNIDPWSEFRNQHELREDLKRWLGK